METQTVEYKQTWRDDFLKEICGFANAQGGTLYIGIADNGEVEAWGQGIERIWTYCANHGSPAPEWRFDGAGIWTIFYNKISPNSEEKSSEKGSQKSSQKILEQIAADTRISTQKMADYIGISRRAIAKTIAKLQAEGILRRIGPDKGGHWEIVEKNKKQRIIIQR